MFGTEAQTELDDLKVVATKSGGEMKYIARTGEGSRPRQIGDLRAPGYRNQSGHHGLSRLTRMADTVHNDFASTDVTPHGIVAAVITAPTQLFEDPYQRKLLTSGFGYVRYQQSVEF